MTVITKEILLTAEKNNAIRPAKKTREDLKLKGIGVHPLKLEYYLKEDEIIPSTKISDEKSAGQE